MLEFDELSAETVDYLPGESLMSKEGETLNLPLRTQLLLSILADRDDFMLFPVVLNM